VKKKRFSVEHINGDPEAGGTRHADRGAVSAARRIRAEFLSLEEGLRSISSRMEVVMNQFAVLYGDCFVTHVS